jgi:hypothetical protein
MKNNHLGYKKKAFGRKSNSLKVFRRENKKSSRTLKNVLSDKNMNQNGKKSRQGTTSKKEKKKTVTRVSNPGLKIKNNSKKNNEEKENKMSVSKSKNTTEICVSNNQKMV